MRTVRIGILDEEEAYAGKLSAYLNRMGNGSWNVAAFTDEQVIDEYMTRKRLDILAGTDAQILSRMKKKHNDLYIIWLKEAAENARGHPPDDGREMISICRYTSAKVIGKAVGEVAAKVLTTVKSIKPMVAVYSPVGRCGKTSLALRIIQDERFGDWLYIGMEDYGFLGETVNWEGQENLEWDSFLYFVKERNQEKLHALLQSGHGIIPSAFSPFDTKQIDEADIKWLFGVLQQVEMYTGVVFDIGTGILPHLRWLALFDYILVPFLPEAISMGKRSQFESLIDAYGLEDLREKMGFVNMRNDAEVAEKIEEVGLKRWSG